MKNKAAEDYLDRLLNSVNDEKVKKDKYKETAKMLEHAMVSWDSNFANQEHELETPEYETLDEKKESSKSTEKEDFLDAMLSDAQNIEFGMNRRKSETNGKYSRISKSEAEFLREFEAELAGEEDSLGDILAEFEKAAKTEESLESKGSLDAEDAHVAEDQDIPATELEDISVLEEQDSSTLDDFDLAALVNEAANVMLQAPVETPLKESLPEETLLEPSPFMEEESSSEMQAALNEFAMATEPIPMDEIPEDMFDELFSGEGGLDPASIPTEMQTEEDGLDLGNLGEEDLMNLLAGSDGLEDIGNMLNKGEVTEISQDELDAFGVFAENEMSAPQAEGAPVTPEEEGKKKKGGLLGKIKGFFAELLKDEEDEVVLKSGQASMVEVLTSENADILAELDALEEMPSKKDNKKKEKKKKEKKEKKPKEPKKPKAPKEPKPKKEKKPKPVDNTPPLPKKPVIMIWIMAVSMVALVLVGIDMVSYNTPIANAKTLQNQGLYAEAFTELNGLTIKEKDMELYSKLAILATVDSEINAYEVFAKAEVADKAFDSLICAAGRCYINAEDAEIFGCLGQLEILKTTVTNELQEKYNMTYEEAIEMYTIRYRDDYTLALYKKLTELGIEWD